VTCILCGHIFIATHHYHKSCNGLYGYDCGNNKVVRRNARRVLLRLQPTDTSCACILFCIHYYSYLFLTCNFVSGIASWSEQGVCWWSILGKVCVIRGLPFITTTLHGLVVVWMNWANNKLVLLWGTIHNYSAWSFAATDIFTSRLHVRWCFKHIIYSISCTATANPHPTKLHSVGCNHVQAQNKQRQLSSSGCRCSV